MQKRAERDTYQTKVKRDSDWRDDDHCNYQRERETTDPLSLPLHPIGTECVTIDLKHKDLHFSQSTRNSKSMQNEKNTNLREMICWNISSIPECSRNKSRGWDTWTPPSRSLKMISVSHSDPISSDVDHIKSLQKHVMIQSHLRLNFRRVTFTSLVTYPAHSELLIFLQYDRRNVDRSLSNEKHIVNLASPQWFQISMYALQCFCAFWHFVSTERKPQQRHFSETRLSDDEHEMKIHSVSWCISNVVWPSNRTTKMKNNCNNFNRGKKILLISRVSVNMSCQL